MRFYALNTAGDIGDDELCFLHDFVDGIGMKAWRVHKGERLASIYPADAKIFMSKESPGIKLSALIGNTRNMFLASSEFRSTVENHCKNEIEYLPFTLYDHRKRVLSRDYFLINPIGTYDCLDFQASQIVWDDEEPNEIIRINKRVLLREKLKDAPQLFRIDRDASTYVVGERLASEMKDRGFTNVLLIELPTH